MKSRIQFLTPGVVAVALTLASTAHLSAGGTVNFGNCSSNKVINGQTASPVTAANNVQAALYWSPLGSNSFTQLGATVAVGTPLPGLFIGGTRTTGAATAGGTNAKFRVRAWGGGYATYEEALLHDGVLVGQSAVFTNATGNVGGAPPTPPESLLSGGLATFTLTPNVVVPQPLLTGLVSQPDGFAQISGQGKTSVTYGIEAAGELTAPISWQRIGSNTANGSGLFLFTDTNAPAFPMRFYRAVYP